MAQMPPGFAHVAILHVYSLDHIWKHLLPEVKVKRECRLFVPNHCRVGQIISESREPGWMVVCK